MIGLLETGSIVISVGAACALVLLKDHNKRKKHLKDLEKRLLSYDQDIFDEIQRDANKKHQSKFAIDQINNIHSR